MSDEPIFSALTGKPEPCGTATWTCNGFEWDGGPTWPYGNYDNCIYACASWNEPDRGACGPCNESNNGATCNKDVYCEEYF